MLSNIRVGDLLNALSKKEKADLQRFINSPYFLEGPIRDEVSGLLTFILEQTEEGNPEENLNKEQAQSAVFKEKGASENKLEKILSHLHQSVKRYISVKQQERTEKQFEYALAQLEFYRERGLTNRYDSLRHTLYTQLESEKINTPDTINNLFLLEYESIKFEYLYNGKKAYTYIPQTLESLELNYFHTKLELLNRYLIVQKVALFTLPEDIQESIDNTYFPEKIIVKNPIVNILFKVFSLLKQDLPGPEDFSRLQNLITIEQPNLPEGFLRLAFTYLRNFCAILVNANHTEFYPILFDLFRDNYERGILHYEDKILATSCVSICYTALQVNEIIWCQTFLEENEDKILNDTPDKDYFKLSKAIFFFGLKEHQNALDILPPVLNQIDLHLLARRLELMCYYELESEILDAKIDAFKMYISRASKSVLSAALKERHTNFINLLSQLHAWRYNPKKDKARILTERIEAKELVTEREWLLTKAREMK